MFVICIRQNYSDYFLGDKSLVDSIDQATVFSKHEALDKLDELGSTYAYLVEVEIA